MAALHGMDVVILAGGLGSRIRPVLGDTPKILAPVHGRPFLDHLLDRMALMGADRVILSLGFLAGKIQEYLAKRATPLPVVTVIEQHPLGTAGALRLAAAQTKTDPVLVMNGDTWLDTNYEAFVAGHRAHKGFCSILCVHVGDTSRYGRIELAENGTIARFAEKSGSAGPGIVSGGAYLFSRRALDELLAIGGSSLERDFLQKMPAERLHAHVERNAAFLDIGTPESLREAGKIISAKG